MAGTMGNWAKVRRLWAVASLLGLVVFAVGAYMAVSALAAPPAAPSITVSPANPTSSTTAAFTYKDATTSGFTKFQCSRDGGAYAD